ncbi:MAG TPA: mechanosensitive ion channel domain-containing protein [Puia sp.]|nr:mechanosensitive ion channel domain-containing protein [Puia sp.]
MKNLLILCLLTMVIGRLSAQDTLKQGNPRLLAPADTSTPEKKTVQTKEPRRKKGTFEREKVERRKFDSSLFTSSNIPSRSDYLASLEKIFTILSQVPAVTTTFIQLDDIDDRLDDEDSALQILKERIMTDDRTLNIRNLQMFNTLLDELDKSTNGYNKVLDQYDKKLDEVKKNIATMRKDTLMLHIFRDSALKASFTPQLLQLRTKWRQADSLVRLNGDEINDLQARTTANAITIEDLTYRVDQALSTVGTKAFGKERRYLWEPRSPGAHSGFSRENLKKSVTDEQQLARYYFANTRSKRQWLLFTGLLFFFWIAFNFRRLRRMNAMKTIEDFKFRYIKPWPVISGLVFMLSLAPLFDAHAPAIYIESTQFLLMLLLTIIFYKQQSRMLFFGWCVFMLLFLLVPITRILGLPFSWQRWIYLIQNGVSVALGLFYLFDRRMIASNRPRLAKAAAWLYVTFNLLAVICNLWGRVTLSQIFSATAVYTFAQTVSLAVFVRSVVEAFLLQIQTSRIRKKYPEHFDHDKITRSIGRFFGGIAIVLWLIVFFSNLNLFDAINDFLTDVFNTPRQVGSLPFTLGGILLFAGIIWVANFLQKYIAYFFGDIGDDASLDDSGQRSRLLVTRLILLTVGFLLAVGASGLSIDRITVIIGALGVGIGLGLQSIVNNFVSGIILIFDRPLRLGDTVEIGDKKGRVKEIGIRSSTLLTEEGAEVIIPNGDVLAHNIVNWTLSNNHVRMSLSFTVDRQHADAIQPDAIKEIVRGSSHVFTGRQPDVLINILNSKSIEIKVLFWGNDITKTTLTSAEVRAAIYRYLDKQGINVE